MNGYFSMSIDTVPRQPLLWVGAMAEAVGRHCVLAHLAGRRYAETDCQSSVCGGDGVRIRLSGELVEFVAGVVKRVHHFSVVADHVRAVDAGAADREHLPWDSSAMTTRSSGEMSSVASVIPGRITSAPSLTNETAPASTVTSRFSGS